MSVGRGQTLDYSLADARWGPSSFYGRKHTLANWNYEFEMNTKVDKEVRLRAINTTMLQKVRHIVRESHCRLLRLVHLFSMCHKYNHIAKHTRHVEK